MLALESSAVTASAALCRDGTVLGEEFVNNGLTHSETLLPMAQALLRGQGLAARDVDAFAVAAGPGSFTGVRIGIAAVKGLAFGAGKPCVGVSTLAAMAACQPAWRGELCCLMDARRSQFYYARFACDGQGNCTRRTPDAAAAGAEIAAALRAAAGPVLCVGDGARAFAAAFGAGLALTLPEGDAVFQRAAGVATLACRAAAAGETVEPARLTPVYLRLPQAERELRAREAAAGR